MALYMAAHLAGAQGEAGILQAVSFQQLHTAAPGASYAQGWGDQQGWTGGFAESHREQPQVFREVMARPGQGLWPLYRLQFRR